MDMDLLAKHKLACLEMATELARGGDHRPVTEIAQSLWDWLTDAKSKPAAPSADARSHAEDA